jgi:hypothetical protein
MKSRARRRTIGLFAGLSLSAWASPSLAQIADPVVFQTANGNYLTAANGGGLGSSSVPLRTDASTAGANETFWLIFLGGSIGQGSYAIVTPDMQHFVTAVGGGGRGGGINNNTAPIHTDATAVGSWERWTVNLPNLLIGVQAVTIQMPDGNFLSAVNGGGVSSTGPVSTDATTLGPNQIFEMTNVNDLPCPGGEARCNGTCVNEQTDAANCGGCGYVCPASSGFACQQGLCRCVNQAKCGAGQPTCGGKSFDGSVDQCCAFGESSWLCPVRGVCCLATGVCADTVIDCP